MTRPTVLVTFAAGAAQRAAIAEVFADIAEIRYWPDEPEGDRDAVLRASEILLSYDPFTDLGRGAIDRLENCRLLQCLTAGIDFLPLRSWPRHIPVAYNAGAYAEPMAEHVLAMALGAAKRLAQEHEAMRSGEFNQFKPTKRLAGRVCGILGYGQTGREVARLMRRLDVRVQALNRSGKTGDPVDFIGTLDDLDAVLEASDILVITVALTRRTEGILDAARLGRMKPDAILVNVARGEIVDQEALYLHLQAQPGFTACLEAWWVEPVRHGRFELEYPFLDLPNVIASPHNSAMTDGAIAVTVRRGAENARRLLAGEEPRFIAGEDDLLH